MAWFGRTVTKRSMTGPEGLIWTYGNYTLTLCCSVWLIYQRCSHKWLTLTRWGARGTVGGRSVWTPHGAPAEQHSPKQLQAGPDNLALKIITKVIIKGDYRFANFIIIVTYGRAGLHWEGWCCKWRRHPLLQRWRTFVLTHEPSYAHEECKNAQIETASPCQ